MFGIASPNELRRRGIIGMNQRNFSYIGRYNDRKRYPNVDDKLKTKQLAIEHGIAVPHLISTIRYQHDVAGVFKTLQQHDGFCIKPAKGSGGKGILVIIGRDEDGYRKANGDFVSQDDIVRHISNILAGLFSLGGSADTAVIEALIEFDPVFTGLSHQGVPDIRLIVFKGYPVMSMLRLATHASDGKANLHQGAIGVGIDISNGHSVAAVQFDQPVTTHPDTDKPLSNISIHNWDSMLHLAAGCFEMSDLGFLGVDIVLDKRRGPLVLELNARPGLAIQIANQRGLLPRLKAIEALPAKRGIDIEQRVIYVKREFSADNHRL